MDLKKILSDVGHSLVAHWVSTGLVALGAVAVSYWGVFSAGWSWPGAVVIAMVVIAAALIIRDRIALNRAPAKEPEWSPFPPKWNDPPQQIFRQHYQNESVDLDGKQFVECTFVNVKFIYNGTGSVNLLNCMYGLKDQPNPVSISTSSPAIYAVVMLLSALKMLNGAFTYDIHKAGTR